MSIAEKLREAAAKKALCGGVDHIALALTSEPARCDENCRECTKKWHGKLADAIEAEINASKSTPLPDGIEWPRFEDGELVKFGDEFTDRDGVTEKVTGFFFYEDKVFVNPSDRYSYGETVKRPEPEVLDADGVPIKVGDTVYGTGREQYCYTVLAPASEEFGGRFMVKCKCASDCETCYCDPSMLTHRKPDTQEAIDADAAKTPCAYFGAKKDNRCAECPQGNGDDDTDYVLCRTNMTHDLLRRQRKLLGGGQ